MIHLLRWLAAAKVEEVQAPGAVASSAQVAEG